MADDHWSSASAYDRFMGRWSRRLALEFVRWLHIVDGSSWLDIGCGTGALTTAIYDNAHPSSVTAVDPAAEFVAYCTSHLAYPNLRVIEATLDTLPVGRGGYDAVVSNLVLNFLPDPVAGLQRMRLACSPDGCVAACVWDYSSGMQFLRLFWDAAIAADPSAAGFDEGVRFPLCRPDALTSAFHNAGLRSVELTSLTIPTVFKDFEDYWSSFSLGTGPAPAYVASLSTAGREVLASRLKAITRSGAGDAIHLWARAWAVKGVANTDRPIAVEVNETSQL